MARSRDLEVLYIGIGSHVVAIRAATGDEVWRTKIKRSAYLTLHQEGEMLFAGAGGELYCLNTESGEIRWHNPLKGLGLGLVSFTNSTATAAIAAARAAAAASTAAM